MVERKYKSKDFSKGLYCGAYFKKGSQILNELENIKKYIKNNINSFGWSDEKEDKDGKHVTIMYSKNAPSSNIILLKDFPSSFDIYFKGFDIFPYGEGYSTIVALIDDEDKEFQNLHDYFKNEYGLIASYPDYNPHISIGVFENKYKPFVKKFIESFKYEHPYDERTFGSVYYVLDSAND